MDILAALKQEESNLRHQLKGIEGAIAALDGRAHAGKVAKASLAATGGARKGKRTMSAAVRAQLSQKAKERWARIRAGKSAAPKRTMSAAVRARLSQKAKERWARVRAEKNKGAKKK